jgi:hypothetical protein
MTPAGGGGGSPLRLPPEVSNDQAGGRGRVSSAAAFQASGFKPPFFLMFL